MHCRACGCELDWEEELCTLCELEYESYLDELFERRGCTCHELDMECQPCAWCVNDMAMEVAHEYTPSGTAVVGVSNYSTGVTESVPYRGREVTRAE